MSRVKLEEGMYVRSKVNGMIAKITDIEILCVRNPAIEEPYTKDIRYILDNNLNRGFCESEKDSVKANHNIIDLIEVGDYVNGYYVSKIWEENEITHYVDETPIKRKERQITIQAPSYGGIIHLKNEDIKSIVTKEQFESMSYKIGE